MRKRLLDSSATVLEELRALPERPGGPSFWPTIVQHGQGASGAAEALPGPQELMPGEEVR